MKDSITIDRVRSVQLRTQDLYKYLTSKKYVIITKIWQVMKEEDENFYDKHVTIEDDPVLNISVEGISDT